MKKQAMTRGELLNLLTTEAQEYREEALLSVERSRHMNNLSPKDISRLKKEQRLTQRLIDALLVDFINRVGAGQCLDYGLYTEHLKSKSDT